MYIFQAARKACTTIVNTHDLLKAEVLSETQLAEVEHLAQMCNAYEGLDIKLNWNILRGHMKSGVTSFLYYEAEQLVGFLPLFIFNFNPQEAEVSGMVHPEHRRRGIFTGLLGAAQEECRSRGITQILFIVDHHAQSGKAFVQAQQLQTSEVVNTEYKMTLGNPILPASFEQPLTFSQAQPDETLILRHLTVVTFDLPRDIVTDWYKAQHIVAPDRRYYLARLNDVYIGKIDVSLGEHEALIYNFGILPEYRGRGYGRQMLARTIQAIIAIGQQHITLEVETANRNALRLYESCGFKLSSCYDYYKLEISA